MNRSSGILLHLSSLPSPHGIGTMGQAARDFVDFLARAGQKYWQILPICPTSYGDSPYQSFSTFAGNPYFIALDLLAADGLLLPEEYEGIDCATPSCTKPASVCWTPRRPTMRIFAGKTPSGCRIMPCSWP